MGGNGSGSYYRWNKKDTTNDYLYLDINRWRTKGSWLYYRGVSSWSSSGNRIAAINYSIYPERLEIILSWNDKSETKQVQKIRITSRQQPFGNCRYYFVCSNCRRKVFKLYAGTFFYCRKCCDLTYVSCQESHKYNIIARMLGMSNKDFAEYDLYQEEEELYWNGDKKIRKKIEKQRAKRELKKYGHLNKNYRTAYLERIRNLS